MLKYSVQLRLFAILWVIQTIHKEEPMYAVLDKVTIKSEILPYLSTTKRGYETKSCLIEVINAILYKHKTGCQWEFLPPGGSIIYSNRTELWSRILSLQQMEKDRRMERTVADTS